MRVLEAISWALTLLMSTLAGLRMLNLWLSSGASAPQYAAEAAGILAMVVVPYVFSRGVRQLRLVLGEGRAAAVRIVGSEAAPLPVREAA